MLLKDMPVQIKAGPDDGLAEGQFTAYASVFGNIDSYGDVVARGAFAKDLSRWEESGNPIPLLFGHNMSDPDYNLGHVVEAVEDDHGLLVTAQLDLENPKALQTYRMLKGRRINQMSFAYDVIDEATIEVAGREGDTPRKANELRELRLYEVSVVTIGANQETEVLAVKTAADALLSGTKAGRAISAKNEAELRKAHEAIGNVLAAIGEDENSSDQEKASGETEAKSGASDEEHACGAGPFCTHAKSSASDEEPKSGPSVDIWATQLSLLALVNE